MNKNTTMYMHENNVENIVSKMGAILSRTEYVNIMTCSWQRVSFMFCGTKTEGA